MENVHRSRIGKPGLDIQTDIPRWKVPNVRVDKYIPELSVTSIVARVGSSSVSRTNRLPDCVINQYVIPSARYTPNTMSGLAALCFVRLYPMHSKWVGSVVYRLVEAHHQSGLFTCRTECSPINGTMYLTQVRTTPSTHAKRWRCTGIFCGSSLEEPNYNSKS